MYFKLIISTYKKRKLFVETLIRYLFEHGLGSRTLEVVDYEVEAFGDRELIDVSFVDLY